MGASSSQYCCSSSPSSPAHICDYDGTAHLELEPGFSNFDPRSPTIGIDRTPIEIVSNSWPKVALRQKELLKEKENNLTCNDNIITGDEPLLQNIDPRSPSSNILRTPLQENSKNSKQSEGFINFSYEAHNAPQNNKRIIDPRSPSAEINRTPIQIEKGDFTTQLSDVLTPHKDQPNIGPILDPRSPSDKIYRTPLQNVSIIGEEKMESSTENKEIQSQPNDAILLTPISSIIAGGNLRRTVLMSNAIMASPSLNRSIQEKSSESSATESATHFDSQVSEDCSSASLIANVGSPQLSIASEHSISNDDIPGNFSVSGESIFESDQNKNRFDAMQADDSETQNDDLADIRPSELLVVVKGEEICDNNSDGEINHLATTSNEEVDDTNMMKINDDGDDADERCEKNLHDMQSTNNGLSKVIDEISEINISNNEKSGNTTETALTYLDSKENNQDENSEKCIVETKIHENKKEIDSIYSSSNAVRNDSIPNDGATKLRSASVQSIEHKSPEIIVVSPLQNANRMPLVSRNLGKKHKSRSWSLTDAPTSKQINPRSSTSRLPKQRNTFTSCKAELKAKSTPRSPLASLNNSMNHKDPRGRKSMMRSRVPRYQGTPPYIAQNRSLSVSRNSSISSICSGKEN